MACADSSAGGFPLFRRIATYSASLYGVTLVSSAISFAVTMIVAKRISREALGLYGFYVTVYAFLGMLLCSGINQALVKRLGEAKDASPLVRFALSLSLVLAIACWPLAFLLHRAGALATAFGVAALPFFVLQLLAASVFRAGFEKKKEVTLRLAVSLLNSAITVGLVFLAFDPERAPIIGDFA